MSRQKFTVYRGSLVNVNWSNDNWAWINHPGADDDGKGMIVPWKDVKHEWGESFDDLETGDKFVFPMRDPFKVFIKLGGLSLTENTTKQKVALLFREEDETKDLSTPGRVFFIPANEKELCNLIVKKV